MFAYEISIKIGLYFFFILINLKTSNTIDQIHQKIVFQYEYYLCAIYFPIYNRLYQNGPSNFSHIDMRMKNIIFIEFSDLKVLTKIIFEKHDCFQDKF